MKPHDVDRTVQEILAILERSSGSDYIGEPVSQLEHALQAAHFARQAGFSNELVLAALLHDIGHLIAGPELPRMAGLGVMNHEDLGAEFLLSRGFSSEVAELVRGHVQGKRYLTLRSAGYASRLSPASRGTLEFQGGPMSEQEAKAFESERLFEQKIQLRKLDEAAKRTEFKADGLETYADALRADLNR